jgi:hypothetical protein
VSDGNKTPGKLTEADASGFRSKTPSTAHMQIETTFNTCNMNINFRRTDGRATTGVPEGRQISILSGQISKIKHIFPCMVTVASQGQVDFEQIELNQTVSLLLTYQKFKTFNSFLLIKEATQYSKGDICQPIKYAE